MITLTTIVYDGNIDSVLAPSSYFSTYKGRKLLVVNNLTKSLNTTFDTLYVKDYAEEAKRFFKLDINESTKGYYYTIPYFVMLLKLKTSHVLNVSSDCTINFEKDFIKDSIEELKKDDILSTTLEWSPNVGKHEAVKESSGFYYSKGFSDQVFLVDVKKLRNIDYNIQDDWDYYGMAAGSGAVFHGGNSFEKRVATYMKHQGKFRGIYKKYNYKHK